MVGGIENRVEGPHHRMTEDHLSSVPGRAHALKTFSFGGVARKAT